MRWLAGIAAVLMGGCGPGSDPNGFSRLAFLRDGDVHRTDGHSPPVSAVFTDPPSPTHPTELVWMPTGALLSLYNDTSVGRVDEVPLQRLGTFDCGLQISDAAFRIEGNLLITEARGSASFGTGETQTCSFVIEPVTPDGQRVLSFDWRTVSTNGDSLAVSCGELHEGLRIVEFVDLARSSPSTASTPAR